MTWGWAVKGDNLGTPAESAVKATWPDYNAQYLKNKLDEKERRFDTSSFAVGLDDVLCYCYPHLQSFYCVAQCTLPFCCVLKYLISSSNCVSVVKFNISALGGRHGLY